MRNTKTLGIFLHLVDLIQFLNLDKNAILIFANIFYFFIVLAILIPNTLYNGGLFSKNLSYLGKKSCDLA